MLPPCATQLQTWRAARMAGHNVPFELAAAGQVGSQPPGGLIFVKQVGSVCEPVAVQVPDARAGVHRVHPKP